jgi:hypothetical protein
MKHASAVTLRQIAPLLARLRALPGLKEKSDGKFYRGGSAFLHFHEDPAGLFADVKMDGEWTRHAVNSETAQTRLVRDARRLLR